MKPWYLSKTLWLNMLAAALAAIEVAFGALKEAYGPAAYLYASVAVSVANVWLRFVTTQPIGKE